MNIVHVVGARPNFVKASPLVKAFGTRKLFTQRLVHTGQHYDKAMSQVFFKQLGLPEPDQNLAVGSSNHAQQTAAIMKRFDDFLERASADLLVVYGDVNSTVAAALVAAKRGIRIAHVEAGLRSGDRTMPEEINRIVTDSISDLLFTHSDEASTNLYNEGVSRDRVFFVGNVMIDTLVALTPNIDGAWPTLSKRLGFDSQEYLLLTLHRPCNADNPDRLRAVITGLANVAGGVHPIVFPCHPRTRRQLDCLGLGSVPNVKLLEPLPYIDFVAIQKHARLVITDSGGVQEETTYLKIPCLTFRSSTERAITVTSGSNRLVGPDPEVLIREVEARLKEGIQLNRVPPLWDGRAAERIVCTVVERVYG